MPRATTGLSYLTFGLVVLGSIIFTVFMTIPQWNDLQAARLERDQAIVQREDRKQFLVSLDARKEEMDRHAVDVQALGVALPDQFVQADVIASLQGAAASSGAVISEMGEPKKLKRTTARTEGVPVENEQEQGLEIWDSPVILRGTYAQIRGFIQALERSLVVADVQNLEIAAEQTSAGQATDILKATFTLRTYVQLVP